MNAITGWKDWRKYFRVCITTRPNAGLRYLCAEIGVRYAELLQDGEENIADIRNYVHSVLEEHTEIIPAEMACRTAEAIINKSDGIMMCAVMLTDMVLRGTLTADEITEYHGGMSELYRKSFSVSHAKGFNDLERFLLCVIVAILGRESSVPVSLLRWVSNSSDAAARAFLRTIEAFLSYCDGDCAVCFFSSNPV